MTELQQYIRSYFDTSEEQSALLTSLFKKEVLKKNEFHTTIGSRFGNLSFVQDGYLRIFKQSDKKEVTQWVSSPGEFTTDLGCMMFDQPARWNIQALSDCTLYTLAYADYTTIKEQIPNWPEIEKLFLAKCFMTIEERIFSFISMNAEQRYTYLLSSKPALFQFVPQQYLASMLGMTPETMSRMRAKSIS